MPAREHLKTMLTPIRFDHIRIGSDNRQIVYWLYRCECGNKKVIARKSYRSKNTISCGCHGDKVRRANFEKGRKTCKPFEKGHKTNLGKKFTGKKSSVAGKKVLWEYPGNPLKGRKVFLTEKELQDVWAGVTPVENYFPKRDESI